MLFFVWGRASATPKTKTPAAGTSAPAAGAFPAGKESGGIMSAALPTGGQNRMAKLKPPPKSRLPPPPIV